MDITKKYNPAQTKEEQVHQILTGFPSLCLPLSLSIFLSLSFSI